MTKPSGVAQPSRKPEGASSTEIEVEAMKRGAHAAIKKIAALAVLAVVSLLRRRLPGHE